VLWLNTGIGLAICLACSTLGFKRVLYFVSLSYALSMGSQAIVFGALFSNTLAGWPLVQVSLVLAYGLRLGSFLLLRARNPGYQKELNQSLARSDAVNARGKVAIWIGVSLLYVLLFLPTQFIIAAQAHGASTWSEPFGVVVMAVGLLLEAAADQQKSRFKAKNAGRFCDVALYRMVRCPNYLGELTFWFGAWFAAVAAYESATEWILATLGFLYLAGVMIGATRRLEAKRWAEYGSDPAYRQYAATVPVLIPLIPVYSLRAKAP